MHCWAADAEAPASGCDHEASGHPLAGTFGNECRHRAKHHAAWRVPTGRYTPAWLVSPLIGRRGRPRTGRRGGRSASNLSFLVHRHAPAGAADPDEILAAVLDAGLASRIEIDAPQHFRGFPAPADAELDRTRGVLERHGARLNVLGCYLDVSPAPGVFLSPEQGVDQLRGQVRAARRLGAWGVRVGLGFVPDPVLTALVPVLEEHDLIWVEEVQGPCRPDSEQLHAVSRWPATTSGSFST